MRRRLLVVALGLWLCHSAAEAQEPKPPPHIVELVDLLGSADAEVRAQAGKELLALADAEVRTRAREDLLASGPVALRALLDAAGGQNAIVAEEARRVLTSAGPEAIESIRAAGFFNSFDRPWRRHEAAAAVARMGDTVLPRTMKDLTTADPAGSGFAFSVGVLFQMGDRAVEVLIPLLKHPKPKVRYEAAVILSQRKGPGVYEALLEASEDEDGSVRMYAALGLGNIGDHRAAEPLLAALHDPVFGIRQAAAASLGKIYEPRFLGRLARLARGDENIQVRNTASNVLIYYSHDPVGVRIGKRYKPYRLSPAYELTIQLAFALRFALTGGFLLVLAVIVARRMRAGDGAHWVTVAWTAGLAAGSGFLWGRVVEHIWYVIEYLLLFGVVPAVAVLGCVPVLMFLRRDTARPALRAWLITVGGLYAGYGVGWLALWGYLGF